ncbi:SprT family zinc-dependent metalloprotease [Neptuniibacter sp. CAU 1671]|uniref:M48 family metallopeptidase n=1 Tax=Neptuniibacter sp. CAU 1671 TaxID=3032593 RepID=UPI0031F3FB97
MTDVNIMSHHKPIADLKSIACTVIRSRRKTASLQVTASGVQVRVPYQVTQQWVDQWLASKQSWIEQQYARVQQFVVEIEQGALLPYKGAFLVLSWVHGQRSRVVLQGQQLLVTVAAKTDQTEADQVRGIVKRWYKKQALSILPQRLEFWRQKLQKEITGLKVRDYKRRWGSCSSQGEIALNWRLLMASPTLQDYVMIHELCHLEHFDHSPKFWRAVAQHCPEWRVSREQLKQRTAWMYW